MKIAIILGTRPEIIKLAPIIRELSNRQIGFCIAHTGQHYSYRMDRIFFEQLRLPTPRFNFSVGSGSHAKQTAKGMIAIENMLKTESVDLILVEGDTNTVLAAALAASKIGVKIGHVEAGLRSGDKRMPEEINRIVADHLSDYLFAPTTDSKRILVREGIEVNKIFVTGNTIVDSVFQNIKLADKMKFPKEMAQQSRYVLLTIHRQENVDHEDKLRAILRRIDELSNSVKMPVFYPVHPRTLKRIKQFQIKIRKVCLLPPLDYLTFLKVLRYSTLVLTDSGGVQEEACVLKIPCVTIRDNTERPETLNVGSNVLAGSNPIRLTKLSMKMVERKRDWENPFGDGTTSSRIVDIITRN